MKIYRQINILVGLIFCLINLTTNLFISGAYHLNWGYYPKAGPVHIIYLIHLFFTVILTIILLIQKIKENKNSQESNQAKYILTGYIILSFASLDFTTNYGSNYYPLGYIPTTLFLLIIAYAIIKHNLMDIHIVMKKSLVYSLLVSCITLVYLISVLISEKAFNNLFGYKNITGSILTASFIALIFIPLKNKMQNLVDRFFFKGTPLEIVRENELLRHEILQTERLKAVATLASGMAHEIKNPLTVLKTFTEYLPTKYDDKKFLKKFTPMVAQEVQRIDNLVHELLDFAKPTPPVLKPVNVHELVKNTLDLLSNEYIKHHIKINNDFRPDTALILDLDYNQIKQALLNILLNAIEAMPDGGQLNVSIYTSFEGSKINIKFHDTGVGINTEDLPHIFDPFFSKKDTGTGLGLAITHEIIRKHGGKIYVESIKNKGTIFILEFPTTHPFQTTQPRL